MNPSSGENLPPPPRFELPPQPPASGVERSPDRALEAEAPSETAVGKQQPQLPPPPQTTTATPPPALPVPADPHQAQQPLSTSGLAAADVDLIEKQWVSGTKKVLHENKDDPFKQKNEVSRVKVDYLKKRFNKVIPLDDAVAK